MCRQQLGKNLLVDILRKMLRGLMTRTKATEPASLVVALCLKLRPGAWSFGWWQGGGGQGDGGWEAGGMEHRSLAALGLGLACSETLRNSSARFEHRWWARVWDVGAGEGTALARTGQQLYGGWGKAEMAPAGRWGELEGPGSI